jgi:hypothetical protein
MPRVGFEPTISAFERAKAVHALDRAGAVIGIKVKAIPVTGRGGPQGFETSRLPHFLDNRLKDGGKIVSLTRRPLFTPPPREAAHSPPSDTEVKNNGANLHSPICLHGLVLIY